MSQRYRAFGSRHLGELADRLPAQLLHEAEVVAQVLPFRTNRYVLDELIDWRDLPGDAIFQLTFPQRGMLAEDDFEALEAVLTKGVSQEHRIETIRSVQARMNPHPAGQLELNRPKLDDQLLDGIQHKYRETVLFFPSQGQTCHAYCTYCFRWAQFVGIKELKFGNREIDGLVTYLRRHPDVSDVLFTGGDPMIMSSKILRRYIEPLLDPSLELSSIRIGSKALAYWPMRFTTDSDADDLLRLFEEVTESGLQLAFMAHFSHPRELESKAVREAVRRIRDTGAVIRTQAPLIRRVNDDPLLWQEMWRQQVRLGLVPYYLFVERDTGPRHYFEVPLARAYRIFSEAARGVSGLARTVRGPSMSATPGKVLIDGIAEVGGEHVFVLKMLQGRDPDWANRVDFAMYDEEACWLDDLRPAFGDRFFWDQGFIEHQEDRRSTLDELVVS